MRVELIGSLGLYVIYAATPAALSAGRPGCDRDPAARGGQIRLSRLPLGRAAVRALAGRPPQPRPRLGTAAIILGLLVGPLGQSTLFAPAADWFAVYLGGRWAPLEPLYSAAAVLIVGGVIVTPWAGAALRLRGAEFLGRVSYGLYLVHMPLLMTAFAMFAVALGVAGSVPLFILWAALFLPAAIFAAWLLTRLVDRQAVRLLKKIGPSAKLRPMRPSAVDPAPLG